MRPRERVQGPALGHADGRVACFTPGEAARSPRAREVRLALRPGVPVLAWELRMQRRVPGLWEGGLESRPSLKLTTLHGICASASRVVLAPHPQQAGALSPHTRGEPFAD